MKHIDWAAIEEKQDGVFSSPAPGGYVVRLTGVKDEEAKEYLRINWDFTEPPFEGYNQRTYDRAGFWPSAIFRSYKDSSLGFFKGFITALEDSNPGYTFRDTDLSGMVGKRLGVVLGEEGYTKSNGTPGKRLYVAMVRSVDAIRQGDYEIPTYKPGSAAAPATSSGASFAPGCFAPVDDTGEERLPF